MHNYQIPGQLTHFVGRAREIAEIVSKLQEANCRLLTLVGVGGIGKTSLSLKIAHREVANFEDGVHFIRLQPVAASERIAQAITNELDLPLKGAQEPKQILLEYLSNKDMLLILDNYEHLIDPNGLNLLTEILDMTQAVKILITSREALKLEQEWLYTVNGLSTPSADVHGSDKLHVFESTRLFVARAQKVNPNFQTEKAFGDIMQICRLVFGLPLAIEMAASWVDVLSCDDIIDRIEQGKLDTRIRNIPERHRSLSAVFEQSWILLSDLEQSVFAKLSVFVDDFSREAAEAITGVTPEILAKLVDKSLLHFESNGRYQIHELVRQFAMAKLAEDPHMQSVVMDEHSDYYMAYLNHRQNEFRSQNSLDVMTELGIEIDNIRFAWDRALAADRIDVIRDNIWCLTEFYDINNWYHEGSAALETTAKALQARTQSTSRSIALGLAYVGRGNILHYLGQMDDAKSLIRDGVSILREVDVHTETAHALSLLGRISWMTGDFETAKEAYRDSVALAEKTGDWVTLGFGYLNLSMIAVIEGNFQQSTHLKQTGLSTFQRINHRLGIGIILCIKGEELYLLGHYDQAKDYLLRASEVFVELDNRWHLSNCYENLGHTLAALGDHSGGMQQLYEAMALAQEIDDPRRVTYCHVNLGDMLQFVGRFTEANQHYMDGLTLAQKAHQRLQEAWSMRGLGDIAYHNGHYELARQYATNSLTVCRQTGWKLGIVKALNLLGLTASQSKDLDRATSYFIEALNISVQISVYPVMLETLICIAEMLIDIRDTKSAVQILSDCIEHVAIHASLRQRADALLHDLRRQVPSDVFARLKDGREGTDLSTVANRWHEKLQHLAQVGEPEPLLEPLTRTERKLLMLMDSDLSYPEIAELQHVSINTIKTHRKNIYTKLGVNNRDEAIQRARNLHLI